LKDLHLCLNAHKLEAKVATSQLLGAYNLGVLPQDLIDADFIARRKLSDSLMNWLATQLLYEGMQESFKFQFGREIPDAFIDHLDATMVILSYLFSYFKTKPRNFSRLGRLAMTRYSCPSLLT